MLFGGEGQRLSSSGSTGGGNNAGESSSCAGGEVDVTRGDVTVNESEPTTVLQFRFHDGQRRTQRFNQSHTLQDIRNFVSQ